MSPSLHSALTLAAIATAAIAAFFDVTTGTIPNRLTLLVVTAAPLVHGFLAGPGALGISLLGALACGAVPLLLFARGGMGGGDVKLFAALGALVGSEDGLRIELTAMCVTLLYALSVLAWRGHLLATLLRALRMLVPRITTPRSDQGDEHLGSAMHVRLGAPIALATLLVLCLSELVPWLPI